MQEKLNTSSPSVWNINTGKTLLSFLYEIDSPAHRNQTFSVFRGDGWASLSLNEFRMQSEDIALGLLGLGLHRGDRVSLCMQTDSSYCLADMGCLIAGLVDVPVDPDQDPDRLQYLIAHSESRAIIVSNRSSLIEISLLLPDLPEVKTIVIAGEERDRPIPTIPNGIRQINLDDVRESGSVRRSINPEALEMLLSLIQPDDLATIMYTNGTTTPLMGVMLSHKNITSNVQSTMSVLHLPNNQSSDVAFLLLQPLSNVYVRSLYYGCLLSGYKLYLSPSDIEDRYLHAVHPTVIVANSHFVEAEYRVIMSGAELMTGMGKRLYQAAVAIAQLAEEGKPIGLLNKLGRLIADAFFYSKWRKRLGGRMKYIFCTCKSLRIERIRFFCAAGINIISGYGYVEAGPFISLNVPNQHGVGTAGKPIPNVEVMIGADGTVLTRGPHVMMGYYKAEKETKKVFDDDGWYRTSDTGEISSDGLLSISER